jgi:hypothetical protein
MGYIRKSSKVYSEPVYGGRANRKHVDVMHTPSSSRFVPNGEDSVAIIRPPRPTGAGKIKVWLDQRWS